jgi:hypothetical protein
MGIGAIIMGAGAAAGAGASLYSANQGAKASEKAAAAQQAAQGKAAEVQKQQFAELQKLFAPYIQAGQPGIVAPYAQAGVGAIQSMQDLIGLGGEAQRQQTIAAAQQNYANQAKAYQAQRAEELSGIQKTFTSLEKQKAEAERSRSKKKEFFSKLVSASLGDIGGVLGIKELQPPGIRSLEGALADANLKLFDSSGKITKVPSKDEQKRIIESFNRQTEQGLQKLVDPLTGEIKTIQGDQSYADISRQRQQQAIQGIEQGPLFQQLAQQGENAMLQNASATGGLRGGNIQGALAQYRPNMLNQLIEQQYAKLAGLTTLGASTSQNLLGLGQASAAGTAAAGQQSATNLGNLMVGQGQAQAGGIIGAANAQAQGLSGAVGALTGGFQNYQLLQAVNKQNAPASGIGTGGFAGTYQQAQSMYGGAPVAYQTPAGPGAPGGWYAQS